MSEDKVVAVDLDGVIFEYKEWKGVRHFGKPIRRVKESLALLRKMGFKIVINTNRLNPKADPDVPLPILKEYVKKALEAAGIPFDEIATGGKPLALYYIDDRGIRFNDWEDALMKIAALEENRAKHFA